MVKTVRIQFPKEARQMLTKKEVEVTEGDAMKVMESVNRILKELVQDGELPSRPTFESPDTTRTTGGPAITMKTSGDVSIVTLEEVKREAKRVVGVKPTEVLVL